MQMQKSIGGMETAIDNLCTQIEGQRTTIKELKAKAGHVEKIMYAAGIFLVGALAIGGWIVSSAKDFAMTYYKASLDAQAKITAPATAIPTAPQPPTSPKR